MIAAAREFVEELLDKIDWPLLLALCGVMAASLVVQSSAGGGEMRVVIAQAARFAVGMVALVLLSRVPPAKLRLWTPIVFALTLVAFLSHVSTFPLLAAALLGVAVLFWWRGDMPLRRAGASLAAITAVARPAFC